MDASAHADGAAQVRYPMPRNEARTWLRDEGADIALLIAGVGVSMALPTVPTAVLNTVTPRELGKASGIIYMMQRFVIAIAVASAVFAAYGHLGTPASVTDGFKPALAACVGFALLAALSALAIAPPKTQHAPALDPAEGSLILKEQAMA